MWVPYSSLRFYLASKCVQMISESPCIWQSLSPKQNYFEINKDREHIYDTPTFCQN